MPPLPPHRVIVHYIWWRVCSVLLCQSCHLSCPNRLILHCMYIHVFFIHSAVNGHLHCFRILVIVSGAAMNIGVCVSFWIRVLSEHMPRNGIVRSYIGCSNLQSYPAMWEGSLFSTSVPALIILKWFDDGHSDWTTTTITTFWPVWDDCSAEQCTFALGS